MSRQEIRSRLKKTRIPEICRIIIAVIFIFSGFVKTIDPWGTYLKVSEYLQVLGLSWSRDWTMAFAIWMCAAEMMMGCMLMCRVRLRLISVFSVCSLALFTLITLYTALFSPMEDCGCFGSVIRLTPWQSFFKNLVLLPMSAVMWWGERDRHFFPFTFREGFLTVFFMCLTGTLGYWCYRHLPVIDFLPFKEGVSLRDMSKDASMQIRTMVRCRNVQSGEERVFELEDPEWTDRDVWEFVESWDAEAPNSESVSNVVSLADLRMESLDGDVTEDVIGSDGITRLVVLQSPAELDGKTVPLLGEFVQRAQAAGDKVVCLTTSFGDDGSMMIGDACVECLLADDTVLNVLLRARAGVVTLKDGVIADKRTFHDLREGCLSRMGI